MRTVRTLVLLAAEKAARFHLNDGVGKGLVADGGLDAADFPDTDTGWSDRPGRGSAGPGLSRHAFDPHETERDQERARFAAHVVAALEDRAASADRIVIAAAPRMLGELRARLPPALAARVVAELDKDLVKVPAADLPAHFAGVLAV